MKAGKSAKKGIRRIISLLIALLFTAASICSCVADGKTGDTTTAKDAEITETQATTDDDILEGLPDKKYDGREFVILAREGNEKLFNTDTEIGEVMNDSVYLRNLRLEELYDVKVKVHSTPGGWDNQQKFLNVLNSSVLANDGAFDIVDGYAAYIGSALKNNNFIDLNSLPYIDLSADWWAASVIDKLSIKGKVYLAPCDITTNLWETMICMMFNYSFADKYNIDNPYELVKEGTWTYSKMLDIIKNTANDINGDSKYDIADEYGLVINNDLAINNFHEAFDIPVTKLDEDGMPSLVLTDPKVEWLISELKELTLNNPDCYYTQKNQKPEMGMTNEKVIALFTDDRCFLQTYYLGFGAQLRNMDSDYGIIPYPKYDENQASYQTYAYDWYTLFAIPIDVRDNEFTSLITEAMARLSNSIVIPAYVETVLKEKFARDEDTKLMIDIIRSGLTFDFGVVFSAQLERSGWLTRDCVYFGYNYASMLQSKSEVYQKALDKLLASFKTED